MLGFEPRTSRLEVSRAIQLRHTDRRVVERHGLHGGGFDPPKRIALDLKSNPFDQTRASMRDCDDNILFITELLATNYSLSDTGIEPMASCV